MILVLAVLLLAMFRISGTVVGVVCDYAGDVVPGGSEIVAVHCHYRYGHFSGCVADTRRTVPYLPGYRILEPVGRSLWQRLSVNAPLMAFGRGEL